MKTKINQHMPGPLAVKRGTLPSEQDLQLLAPHKTGEKPAFIMARVNRYAASFKDKRDHANARLLAASYTMADRAGRTLNVDAAKLCAKADLAALILAAQDACNYMGDCVVSRKLRKALPGVFEEPV